MFKTPHFNQEQALQAYYKLHAPIYDATRWSFLFGRRKLMSQLPDLPSLPRILEVGCGTGKNIKRLSSSYPHAHITGIDISPEMLQKASKKFSRAAQVTLLNKKYGVSNLGSEPFDLIIFSYSCTMMGEHVETILQQTISDLSPNGYIAVVDFHASPFSWFRNWMKANHVCINGSLLPKLKDHYKFHTMSVHKAYAGWWSYFLFIGRLDVDLNLN